MIPTREMVRAGAAALKDVFPAISFEEQAEVVWRAMAALLSEPTEGMVTAGFEAMKGDWKTCRDAADDARRCWVAMLSAVAAGSPEKCPCCGKETKYREWCGVGGCPLGLDL